MYTCTIYRDREGGEGDSPGFSWNVWQKCKMFAGTPSNNYDQTAKSLGLISESLKDSGVSISGVSTSIVRVFAV